MYIVYIKIAYGIYNSMYSLYYIYIVLYIYIHTFLYFPAPPPHPPGGLHFWVTFASPKSAPSLLL